ncbi:MAG: hypothetical protein NVS9B3_09230 [Gemmatimonadaceae bacterium]
MPSYHSSRPRRRSRSFGRIRHAPPGFTLLELMIVVAVMGVLVMIGLPKLHAIQQRENMRSATTHMSSLIATAQAAAVRRGRPTALRVRSDSAWVTLDSNGTMLQLTVPVSFKTAYSATLQPVPDTIVFNSRGFPSLLAGTAKLGITANGASDSVCVSRLGLTLGRGCAL